MLFDTMDAHGHDLNLDSITCVSCREAIERGGFCEACRIGWHRKHAYFSRLTYELAKGTARNLSDLRCAVCRNNGSRHGWCEACGVGMLGRFAVRSREDYERAAWELDRLIKANREADRCEYCAAAMVTDTGCITCRIAFKGGEKIDYPSRK